MSYVLKRDGETIATSGAWNPRLFGKHTGASFPEQVADDWSWAHGDVTLEWEEPEPPMPPTQAEIDAQARQAAKAARAEAVEAIQVTTAAGNTFDGDEISQGRMARAIIALQATGTPSVVWVLADNTVIDATVAELVEALALAGAEQAAMWVV